MYGDEATRRVGAAYGEQQSAVGRRIRGMIVLFWMITADTVEFDPIKCPQSGKFDSNFGMFNYRNDKRTMDMEFPHCPGRSAASTETFREGASVQDGSGVASMCTESAVAQSGPVRSCARLRRS